jgi:peptide/nickel transport system ATP-binding protein/oligopeptide transport system ATP-binding protein
MEDTLTAAAEPALRAGQMVPEPVLSVRDLYTYFSTPRGVLHAVDGVSFELFPGETFGIVGESGSGKSVTCRSLIGLLPRPQASTVGTVLYGGRNLVNLSASAMQKVRGAHISMVFQDPMTSLNPVMRVGDQIDEALQAHTSLRRTERRRVVVELLNQVRIPMPEQRLNNYPHQFSGGMRQRVLIAIALACKPKILLADEPTTALDVTIQDQILNLLLTLQTEFGMSMILVSHDLGVIAETCTRVAVMYAGQIVETADTATLLTRPKHPYTAGLLRSLPNRETRSRYLTPIAGAPPSQVNPPAGCRFYDRCPIREEPCLTWDTKLLPTGAQHWSRCRRHQDVEVRDD